VPRDDELTFPDLPPRVVEVLRTLAAAGHEVALVGGSVRDQLRADAIGPGDWDAATSAPPDVVAQAFPGSATWENRFGTVTVGGHPPVEVTSYRTEDGYRDRRRPDEVRFGASLDEDLARRDFTINAMAWLPTDLDAGRGRVVDPFGGRDDLDRRVLRTVGDARDRFGEDALRLLRAARLAGRFDLAIEPATEAAILALAPAAADVSAERVRDELLRILGDPVPSKALRLLERLGLMRVILPELVALRGVPQAKVLPGDALDHVLAAVDAAPSNPPWTRLAALLHDVGKASTLADGHFIGHDRVGAEVAASVLRRLRIPAARASEVVHAVRHHMYAYDASWSDGAVRRFIRRVTPYGTELLFALRRADNLASGVGEAGDANQAELEARIGAELERQPDLLLRNRLAIDGHDLQRELGWPAGPAIGRTLKRLTDLVIDDPTLNERQTLLDLARVAPLER
jgi:tRNA nucleotidyltransferase (CCA-adding enzyme)